jgi:hypothetical protein
MATLISGSTGVNKITDGTIVNADINASAAIAGSKLVMPTGSVLQVANSVIRAKTSVSSTTAKIIETSITLKGTNSSLLIMADIPIGTFNDGNNDVDIALAAGYKTGSVSATSTDYTPAGGSSFSRQTVSGLNGWFASDTMQHGEGYDQYWVESKTWKHHLSGLTFSAGTVVHVSQWCSCAGGNGVYHFGASEAQPYSDSGQEMSLHIMEIAG